MREFYKAIKKIAPSSMGTLIGFGLCSFLVTASNKWDGHLYDRKDCVKLQKIASVIYKVDSCNGRVELLEHK
jgi:hypothetical protein